MRKFTNEYFAPVFKIVLPALESANIKYWIYGGFGYAAMVGRFYRRKPNSDLDLFALNDDFESIEKILENICKENGWEINKVFIVSGRPKIELFINGRERLSVIPVYKTDKYVEFKFREGSKNYPLDILMQVERRLDGLTFFTPQDGFLKILLIEYLKSKNKYPDLKKRIEDARNILSEEEFKEFFPNHQYKESKNN